MNKIVSFLEDFKLDVCCFQELMESSVEFFEKSLGMRGYFLSTAKCHVLPPDVHSSVASFGVGLFSRLPSSDIHSDYYYGGVGDLPTLRLGDETTLWRGLLRVTVKKDSELYTIATTHFTRTDDGSANDKQRHDMKKLLVLIAQSPELILCGDFNAPRGGEIFSMLSRTYKDNIPPHYTSSLDPRLHAAGHLHLMVDGLFSTPHYQVYDVKLTEGISDHKAVTALISKS